MKEIEKVEEIEELDNKGKAIKVIKELIPYVIILITVILIRTFWFTPIIVNGPSMQPTLEGGEVMILMKNKDIKRFDVVVVGNVEVSKGKKEDIIKRVIAMPGESISCENGIVYVNEIRQDEDFSQGVTSDFARVVLGEDEYFVMGDNRENSLDSRKLGAFNIEKIKGKPNLVLFPFDSFGKIK